MHVAVCRFFHRYVIRCVRMHWCLALADMTGVSKVKPLVHDRMVLTLLFPIDWIYRERESRLRFIS
ncbi:hypothetical protein WS68_11540 [Burkholderia sp. TSV86]|nr:hypothetical protein WS68_11540 [Burkholderia sp. TSV86]